MGRPMCAEIASSPDPLDRAEVEGFSMKPTMSVLSRTSTTPSTWTVLEANGKIIDSPPGDLFPEDSPFQWVHSSGQHLLTSDWSRESRFERYGLFLANLGIASTCMLPLIRGSRRLGVLSLGRFYPNAFDEEEVRFLGLVAEQIGL